MVLWSYGSFFLVFLCAFKLLFNKEVSTSNLPYFSYKLNYFLLFFICFYFAFEPIEIYSDKWNYENIFNATISGKEYYIKSEGGFQLYNKFIGLFTNSVFLYFLITAFLYLWGSLKFINKVFENSNRYIVFILMIASLGFYSYGTNTIRQGLALSVFLLAFSELKLNFKTILIYILAILLHKSLIILVVFSVILNFYNRKDNFVLFWILFLIISILFGSAFVNTFGDLIMDSDQRMISYLNDTFENYKSGFRIDFLIYSTLPILFGIFVKRKGFEDEFYNKLLSLYILVNAIWLLVITLPFTDRFAYLSWFLMPFIFMYPMSKKIIFRNQNYWIAGILLFLATISLIITTK
jgi:hypothetical protein